MITNKRNLFPIAFSFTKSNYFSESAVLWQCIIGTNRPICSTKFVQAHDFIDLYLYVCTRMMDTYKNGINILV